jgi:hypothetical protein
MLQIAELSMTETVWPTKPKIFVAFVLTHFGDGLSMLVDSGYVDGGGGIKCYAQDSLCCVLSSPPLLTKLGPLCSMTASGQRLYLTD